MLTKRFLHRLPLNLLIFWTVTPWIVLAVFYILMRDSGAVIGSTESFYRASVSQGSFHRLLWNSIPYLTILQVLSPFFWTGFFISTFRRLSLSAIIAHSVVFSLGWATLAVLFFNTPGGLIGWWLD